MGLSASEKDSHGSVHTLIEVPEPTIQPSCFAKRSLPIRIPRQPCEAEAATLQDKKEESWQYFPRRQRARRQERFFRILQLIFARRASLKAVISLKPNPPFFFGFAIFVHEIQDILRLSGSLSHQKRVKID